MLEVIDHNRVTQESVVMSGPGTAAQWYQNILAFPAVRVQIGRLAFEPQQRLLTLDEARDTALRFAHAHPLEARLAPRVLRWLGWGDTAPLDSVELIASLPMVAFRPRRV